MSDVNPFQSPHEVDSVVPQRATGEGFISDASCGENYSQGWKAMSASFGILLGVTILHAFIKSPGENMDDLVRLMDLPEELTLLAIPYVVLISCPLWVGVSWAFLKAARKQRVDIGDMFAIFSNGYWNAIGAVILKFLIIALGFVALIIPGIILTCRLVFVEFLVIDKKMGPIESIRESWRMSQGHGLTAFLMWLLAIPIMMIGLLLCIVGAIPAGMWVSSAFAVFYNTVAQDDAVTEIEAFEAPKASPEYGRGLDFS